VLHMLNLHYLLQIVSFHWMNLSLGKLTIQSLASMTFFLSWRATTSRIVVLRQQINRAAETVLLLWGRAEEKTLRICVLWSPMQLAQSIWSWSDCRCGRVLGWHCHLFDWHCRVRMVVFYWWEKLALRLSLRWRGVAIPVGLSATLVYT